MFLKCYGIFHTEHFRDRFVLSNVIEMFLKCSRTKLVVLELCWSTYPRTMSI